MDYNINNCMALTLIHPTHIFTKFSWIIITKRCVFGLQNQHMHDIDPETDKTPYILVKLHKDLVYSGYYINK